MRTAQLTLKIGSAKFHIKRAISEMGRAKFREILISGAQFANFPVWPVSRKIYQPEILILR